MSLPQDGGGLGGREVGFKRPALIEMKDIGLLLGRTATPQIDSFLVDQPHCLARRQRAHEGKQVLGLDVDDQQPLSPTATAADPGRIADYPAMRNLDEARFDVQIHPRGVDSSRKLCETRPHVVPRALVLKRCQRHDRGQAPLQIQPHDLLSLGVEVSHLVIGALALREHPEFVFRDAPQRCDALEIAVRGGVGQLAQHAQVGEEEQVSLDATDEVGERSLPGRGRKFKPLDGRLLQGLLHSRDRVRADSEGGHHGQGHHGNDQLGPQADPLNPSQPRLTRRGRELVPGSFSCRNQLPDRRHRPGQGGRSEQPKQTQGTQDLRIDASEPDALDQFGAHEERRDTQQAHAEQAQPTSAEHALGVIPGASRPVHTPGPAGGRARRSCFMTETPVGCMAAHLHDG